MRFIRFTSASLLFLALLFAHSYAQDRGDVVVMKNGDRTTYEIKVLEAGVLSSVGMGSSNISQIACGQDDRIASTIHSIKPLATCLRDAVEASHFLRTRKDLEHLPVTSDSFKFHLDGRESW